MDIIVKQLPVFLQHERRPISFTLLVDNVGIGYVGQDHADHLMSVIKMNYENIKIDWEVNL